MFNYRSFICSLELCAIHCEKGKRHKNKQDTSAAITVRSGRQAAGYVKAPACHQSCWGHWYKGQADTNQVRMSGQRGQEEVLKEGKGDSSDERGNSRV